MKKIDKAKEYVKEHKKQILIGAGGIAIFVGAFFIGKKVGMKRLLTAEESSSLDGLFDFFNELGEYKYSDEATAFTTTVISRHPENLVKNAKEIDEIVFTELAGDIENILTDIHCDSEQLDRIFDCGDGIMKTLKVTMETTKN